jgi:GNAT superfamily N-acetyltransferase
MNSVRLATIEDVEAMSYIHSRTWKSAYASFLTCEYLDNLTDEGWIPIFRRALMNNIHEAAVFETDGILTGCITFGKGRTGQTCNFAAGQGGVCKDMPSELGTCGCNENCGEIISLYVLPEYWSSKQGYQLTGFAVDRLRNQGFNSCYLWVIKGNERAERFYRKFGFKSTGELAAVNLGGRDIVEEKYNYIYI